MAKKEMKSTGVTIMIMIMLGYAQANYNSPFVKIEPNNTTDKLTCPAQCGIDCFIANIAYPICFAICVAKCPKKPPLSVYNCMIGCGKYKSTDANIDARDLSAVNACLQECEKSDNLL
ncbi:uncharacterized protein LOC114378005 [Glycine soja]|uniref:uncharacterized protein LOC114378005 n=1 Tax=Glycine soja TaxID=3848 RepID=UPI00104075F5|nr:uncharacterized protein LOC114378005 [Glycine soja]